LPPSTAAQPDLIQSAAALKKSEIDDGGNGLASAQPPKPTIAAPAGRPAQPASRSSPALPAGLADIAAAIADLKDEAEGPPRRRSEQVQKASRSASAAASQSASAKAKAPPPPREPARIWVQVAGGASKAALPREYARLRTKAPALLAKRPAWTTPLNATNRLLVGPFASEKEARELVNGLAKADVSAFSWTSAAGQEIEKLPAK
jgi:hypothetical protein